MELTASNVDKIIRDCLYKDEEIADDKVLPPDAVVAAGIMSKFMFHPQRLESHRAEIVSMVQQLPDQFLEGKGGGWTFLNLCNDKNDHQWGEHRDMDAFCSVAIGLGLAEWQLPRNMWSILPGGMPYIVFREGKA